MRTATLNLISSHSIHIVYYIIQQADEKRIAYELVYKNCSEIGVSMLEFMECDIIVNSWLFSPGCVKFWSKSFAVH